MYMPLVFQSHTENKTVVVANLSRACGLGHKDLLPKQVSPFIPLLYRACLRLTED